MKRVTPATGALMATLIILTTCRTSAQDMDYQSAREALVQLLTEEGITDPAVVASLRKVERHLFVPEGYRNQSYRNSPLPIGQGQTISQPFIVGYMTQILDLQPADRVLEIGTGSGYQAAILAEIAAEVYTIEIIPSLGEQAERLLTSLGYRNIHVRIGDGYQGWPEAAPFQAIMVTAAPGHIPQPLVDQLAVGGRMIIPVGESYQTLILIERGADGVTVQRDLPVRFVPMTGEALQR
ncbi:MAG: protein-L-isoaspartate(D-aspartate) O-methyltransferase [Bradymonadales bacterium]|nr:protein-L-isoaspartate(D-aspartate) O-methyltransferase [Bradymonadales bacterium]